MSAALLALAVLICIKRICLGLDFNDSPYFVHTITRGDYAAGALFPGLITIGSVWAAVAGNGLVSFRILFASVLAINLWTTYRTLLLVCPRTDLARLLIALTAVIAAASSSFVFGYDIMSSLPLVLIVHYSFRWHRDGRLPDAFALGVWTLLAISIRLPNAVVVLPLLAMLRRSRAALVYAAPLMVAAIVLAVVTLVSSDITSDYYRALVDSVSRRVQVYYAPGALAQSYLRDGAVLLLLCALVAVCVNLPDTGLLTALLVLSCATVGLEFTFARYFRIMLTAIALVSSVRIVGRNGRTGQAWLIAIVAMMTFVPAVGSDTGLLKTTYLSLYLMPVFAGMLLDLLPATALVPAAFWLAALWSYGEVSYPLTQTEPIEIEKLSGIRTTESRAGYTQSIYDAYVDLTATRRVVVLGEPAHMFYYLFEQEPFDKHRFFQNIAEEGLANRLAGTAPEAEGRKPKADGVLVLYLPGSQFDPEWPENLANGAWRDSVYDAFAGSMKAAGFEETPFADHVAFIKPAPSLMASATSEQTPATSSIEIAVPVGNTSTRLASDSVHGSR